MNALPGAPQSAESQPNGPSSSPSMAADGATVSTGYPARLGAIAKLPAGAKREDRQPDLAPPTALASRHRRPAPLHSPGPLSPEAREHQSRLLCQAQLLDQTRTIASDLISYAESWEAKSMERDQILQTLMNWIPEGIVLVGGPPDFPIQMVSRFAREALLCSPAEIVGMSTAAHQWPLRIFRPDGRTVPKSEEMPIFRATRFGEEVHNCELVVYARDGRRFEALVDAVPIRGPAGQVLGAVSCWRDITALNQAKHALEHAMGELGQRVDERTRELNAANEKLRSEVERRQRFEKRLVAMLENEQRRMGQDLHDNIGSQLSGIELLCEATLRQGGGLAARQGLRTMARLIRDAVEDTRRIAYSMAPVPSCPQGLALSLRALARRTRVATGCRCMVRTGGAPIDDPAVALHLYRIAQEAIANAIRHGAAHRITILLQSNGVSVRLKIRDDGGGIAQPGAENRGLGIVTMKVRANALGGFLEVGPNERGGTDVICSVPRCLPGPDESRSP